MALFLTTASLIAIFCDFILFIYFIELIVERNNFWGVVVCLMLLWSLAQLNTPFLLKPFLVLAYIFSSGFLPTYWLVKHCIFPQVTCSHTVYFLRYLSYTPSFSHPRGKNRMVVTSFCSTNIKGLLWVSYCFRHWKYNLEDTAPALRRLTF